MDSVPFLEFGWIELDWFSFFFSSPPPAARAREWSPSPVREASPLGPGRAVAFQFEFGSPFL